MVIRRSAVRQELVERINFANVRLADSGGAACWFPVTPFHPTLCPLPSQFPDNAAASWCRHLNLEANNGSLDPYEHATPQRLNGLLQ